MNDILKLFRMILFYLANPSDMDVNLKCFNCAERNDAVDFAIRGRFNKVDDDRGEIELKFVRRRT